jgi:uncharacterized protein
LFLLFCGTIWNYADHRSTIKLQQEITLTRQYTAQEKVLTKELKAAYAQWEENEYKHSAAYVKDYNELVGI